uniref:putative leucine-rich repeat receptor-like serine/threonine-protein kinase At2g24130 n=1 Tax=Erigeron canadensis TaxID=72917 RepID=UPI001CB9D407|nr:putative leucine-rich repeat receptor-like serine/threonine-protein kinase At2g24130 [Erigeron canadensis]
MISFLFLIVFFSVVSGDENARIFNDRASLLTFFSGITSDPGNVLQNWSNPSTVHVCNWTGITCNENLDFVLEVDLSGASLHGTISPVISKLSRLTVLDLSRNFFKGDIPRELGYLSELKQLSLSSNLLRGKIPLEIGFLNGLQYLDLGSNKLVGDIPKTLFCNGSSSLEYVDISNNSLSGPIPLNEECDVKMLRFLLVWSNRLSGRIPKALANSSKLKWIDLESNFFEGELPFEIVKNLSNLQFVYLSYNNFSGPLDKFFSGLTNSPHLQELELAGNRLSGKIHNTIGNLSKSLVQIHLDDNQISGGIPPNISNLLNLTLLNLSRNSLKGTIPRELCQMAKLERLYLSDNMLSGEIPWAFGNVSKLGLLDLSKNRLSSSIPDTFSSLSQLRRLLLHNNRLVGTIPTSLAQCVNLEILDLSHNQISGLIPREFARLSTLKLYLNISYNHLNGPLPRELSKMNMVLAMDLSSNNFSGEIPAQLGSCIALELLNLSGNALEGPLPDSIGKLPFLDTFDVSLNRLSGKIPESFQKSLTLKQLNFSFNNFSGNTSFSNLDTNSFLGNPGLCSSSIKGMQRCKNKKKKHNIRFPVLFTLLAIAILLSLIPIVLKSKSKKQFSKIFSRKVVYEEDEHERKEQNYRKISHHELMEATGGFCSSSLIGSGQFGQVYKGTLKDNTKIAVKVISGAKTAVISRSFSRECEVLRNTRHRNLIRIVTICSRPDFKALVLPLMQKGSLDDLLYPRDGPARVNLVQMVRILSDVAEGLSYLHHYAPVKVAHCDLKPSNILLDDDMNAVLSDFGIAKLVKEEIEQLSLVAGDRSPSVSSTDGLLCGSIGYIAPEYGMGRQASTQGDVYSFGVLLLEMVTRKRPTDMVFHEGLTLHEWVKSHYPHKLEPIIKEALTNFSPVSSTMSCNSKLLHDMVWELVELGLICTQSNPLIRPTMLDVAHEMATWKEYLSNPKALSTT